MKTLILFACLLGVSYAGPLHASCKADWTFSLACTTVKQRLVSQIKAWSTADNCPNGAGEKCLYHYGSLTYCGQCRSRSDCRTCSLILDLHCPYGSETDTTLKLVHETPVHHYLDDVTFTFAQGSNANSCNVHGYSSSQTWYAILDYSTNYCNMRNLIEGAGLHTEAGFTESTSDRICTQYSSRNCDKY